MTVQQILDTVRDTYGISFNETHTGGGCMALEARIETGHWIVASDEGLCGFRERIEFESFGDNYNAHAGDDHRAMGWFVGVYEHNEESGDWMGQDDSLVNVCDYDAYAADLPRMVGLALARFVETVL
jgi:hypothetical protein